MGTNDFGLNPNTKQYSSWRKVVMWVREDFEAESDEEAIRLVKDGDYEAMYYEYGDEYDELDPDEGGEVIYESKYPVTREIYDEDGEMIWDNKPISLRREEKIDKILDLSKKK